MAAYEQSRATADRARPPAGGARRLRHRGPAGPRRGHRGRRDRGLRRRDALRGGPAGRDGGAHAGAAATSGPPPSRATCGSGSGARSTAPTARPMVADESPRVELLRRIPERRAGRAGRCRRAAGSPGVRRCTDDATAGQRQGRGRPGQKWPRRRADLQKARDERAAAKAAADAEAERQRQLVAEVEAKRAEYEQRLRSLQAESARLGELLRARQAAGTRPAGRSLTTGRPAAPPRPAPAPAKPEPAADRAAGATGGREPGRHQPATARHHQQRRRRAPTGHLRPAELPAARIPDRVEVRLASPSHPGGAQAARGHRHLGTGRYADPAPSAGGTVIWAGPRGRLRQRGHHQPRQRSGHRLRPPVGGRPSLAGQSVGRGDTVGYVGQTGLAGGPHLHFEVRVGGRTYDPLAYMSPG